MKQEIELKFALHTSHLTALQASLDALSAEQKPAHLLVSTYYETADQRLRQHDIGLRVRQHPDQDSNKDNVQSVMTLKTAGRVSGGLHQRPEYNILLPTSQPDLSLLPAEVFLPMGISADQLQPEIQPLFTTRFQRKTWYVSQGDSRIEIALDLGEIIAGDAREPLCELELELLEGETADVLDLAQKLAALPGLRQSDLSKAARGYYLAAQQPYPLTPLPVMRMPAKSTIEQGFAASLKLAMAHWLYHEEVWLRGDEHARAEVRHAISLIRHSLTLFGGIVPRKASTQLRDLLARCDSLLTSDATAEQVAFSEQHNAARLALTRWLVFHGWRGFLDESARAKMTDSFKRFADIQLSRQAAELKSTFSRPLTTLYRDQLARLDRVLDAVHILSGAYTETRVAGWLENWQSLHQAIVADNRADIDRYRQLSVAQPPFWLHSGKKT